MIDSEQIGFDRHNENDMGKPKQQDNEPAPAVRPNILAVILAGVEGLYRKHAQEIADIQGATDDNEIGFAFSVKIDSSFAEPEVKVGIRIPSTITDSMTARLEDENQGGFKFLDVIDGDHDTEDTE